MNCFAFYLFVVLLEIFLPHVFSFVFVASPTDRTAESQHRGESVTVNEAVKYVIICLRFRKINTHLLTAGNHAGCHEEADI